MGLFDFFRKRGSKSGLRYAATMNGGTPFYASFGDNIYASDIIVQSIRCKANEFKKLQPRHVTLNEGSKTQVANSNVAKLLRKPNEYMTTADFLEKITILLELNKNVFIYPMYYRNVAGEKVYTGLYPLKPATVEYLSDAQGKLFINFRFNNGFETTLPASEVIHWRKDYGVNDYFGGGAFGGNDDAGLLTMLKRYDQLTQSIAKALEVSCKINGILKENTYMEDEAKIAEREKFEADLKNNQSGFLVTDMQTEFIHIPRDVKLVDAETIKFFYETILRANGTSIAILNGDYKKYQKEAYYEHALEADIISLGQAITKVLFTDRELSFGNEVICYPNHINFMSMENKIAFANIAMPSGSMMKDEFRELFGYPPLPDGQGQVIAQGYNLLLGEDNQNKIGSTENNGEKEDEQ